MINKITTLIFIISVCYAESVQAQAIDTLIQVGTHKLHFKILKGQGSPILFEAGNGDDGTVWEELLQALHQSTGATLITYDRAGLGKSEIDTSNISFEQEVKDLEYCLKSLGYSKKLFIVSHSFGGYYATLFAHRNPNKVLGAVCIDIALPCFFTPEWSKSFVDAISQENWQLIKKHKSGLYYVLQNLASISLLMRDKALPKKIPATLIAAEKTLPMVKPDEVDQWKKCLKDFGTLPNHQYVLAAGAEHKVWKDAPELVIAEIVKLYQKVAK